MSHNNGHHRESIEALQKRLAAIRQSIRAGKDVWRNRQRERYLEGRLRKLTQAG
jgi:hypothetical protein